MSIVITRELNELHGCWIVLKKTATSSCFEKNKILCILVELFTMCYFVMRTIYVIKWTVNQVEVSTNALKCKVITAEWKCFVPTYTQMKNKINRQTLVNKLPNAVPWLLFIKKERKYMILWGVFVVYCMLYVISVLLFYLYLPREKKQYKSNMEYYYMF